jgi:hypothetical protein
MNTAGASVLHEVILPSSPAPNGFRGIETTM